MADPDRLEEHLLSEWRGRAACAGSPHSLFFPASDADHRTIRQAKAICSVCPVAEECLDFALETNQRAGIWGGITESERRSLRRKWLAERRRAG